MKIAAILLANVSAIMMGNSTAPHNATAEVEEVEMGVHVVYHDGQEVDTWLMIDAIVDHNDHGEDESSHSDDESSDSDDESSDSEDEHELGDAGWCNHVYTNEYGYDHGEAGEMEIQKYDECFDGCFNLGGYVKDDLYEYDGGYYLTHQCHVDDCQAYEYDNGDEEPYCDVHCMIGGGVLAEYCPEGMDQCYSSCDFG